MREVSQLPPQHADRSLAYDDTPVFFSAGDEMLFGILTSPAGAANGITVTMLTGGGYLTSTHRNRMYVRLSRHLAALGYHGLRFDYHGTGESTGAADRFQIDEPFTDDLCAALDWLEGQGMKQHVLVGSCFGSRTALTCAPALPGLQGIVLLSPPTRDLRYVQGEGRVEMEPVGDEGLSAGFLEPFRRVVERGVPVLVVGGRQAMVGEDFQREEIKGIVDAAGPQVEVRILSGPVHQLASLAVQEAVMELTIDWLSRRRQPPCDPRR